MKKFLILLLIAPMLFTACGDDEDDKPYFNPVEGSWVYALDNDYTETRIFTKKFEALVVLTDNGKTTNDPLGVYSIDETSIFYTNGGIHEYIIISDTLQLRNAKTGYTKRFIRKFK